MPLITCPECQKQVSDQAASCPGCGHPMRAAPPPPPPPAHAPPAAPPVIVQAPARSNAGCWLIGCGVLLVGGILLALVGAYFMPQEVLSETASIDPLSYRHYDLTLEEEATVELTIEADKPGVTVYVVAQEFWEKLEKAGAGIDPGTLKDIEGLRMKNVTDKTRDAVLEKGEYKIFVMHPDTAGEKKSIECTITVTLQRED